MALVLSSSDVFAIVKTRHEQIDTDVYLFMRYLLLIFAKAPFSPIIYSSVSYGGLACRHRAFRLYLFAAAALLRRCFSASAPKTALVLFKRQKGYRFNRCPKKFLTHVLILRPYRRNWLWVEKRYIYIITYASLMQYIKNI